MRKLLSILLILPLLWSCKKASNDLDYFYQYYPVEQGHWVSYQVQEINFVDNDSDTLNYQLMEVMGDEFVDDAGLVAIRVERYWRTSDTLQWAIKDVWVTHKLQRRADKTEENVKFTKMVFPIHNQQYWDGNAFNTENKWEYSYDDIHQPYSVGGVSFDSTVTVFQRDELNSIKYEVASEVYAANIGMIYKTYTNLHINTFNIQDVESGVKLEMTYIDSGS